MQKNIFKECSIYTLVQALNETNNPPIDAVRAAVERKSEVVPILLSMLEDIYTYHKELDLTLRHDYIAALFILAELQETRACAILVRIVSLPAEITEDILGGFITTSLARFIVSTYDGNLKALTNIIENKKLFCWARCAVLESLVGLYATGKVTRTWIIDYFKGIFDSPLVQDTTFVTQLTIESCKIHSEELFTKIKAAYSRGLIDQEQMSAEEVATLHKLSEQECLAQFVYGKDTNHLPITNASSEIAEVYSILAAETSNFMDDEEESEDEDECDEEECTH